MIRIILAITIYGVYGDISMVSDLASLHLQQMQNPTWLLLATL